MVVEEILPQPNEAVWDALTNAATISDWLMPTDDFQPVVGARFRLKTKDLSPRGWVDAQVTELDPPHRMTWAWSVHDGAQPTIVTFELTPEGDGTRLKLTHVGEIDPLVGAVLRDGWPGRVELLRRILD